MKIGDGIKSAIISEKFLDNSNDEEYDSFAKDFLLTFIICTLF